MDFGWPKCKAQSATYLQSATDKIKLILGLGSSLQISVVVLLNQNGV